MRIAEEYKRSGYFWLPGNEEHKVPGTLIVRDGGKVELEIVGLLDESIEALNGKEDLSLIIGHVEQDGFVTLVKSFYKTKRLTFGGAGIAKSIVSANMLYCGIGFEKDEELIFDSFQFSIEGLDDWLGLSGIEVQYGETFRTATITYNPQESITYSLPDGWKLEIFFTYSLPGFSSLTSAQITQKAFLRLVSQTGVEISQFIDRAYRLTYLLCLALDTSVSIREVSVRSNLYVEKVNEEISRPLPIKVFYQSNPFTEIIPKIDLHRMLFSFGVIRGNAESIFGNWMSAFEVIRPALGLYFSAVRGDHKYLDGKFLALAQALETYHRRTSSETLMDEHEFRSLVANTVWQCPKDKRKWLLGRLKHGNEINLGSRIKKIIEPFKSHIGSKDARKKLVRSIVITRNYFTHYSKELESEAAKGRYLWEICDSMEAIFQLHLLIQLGFTREEIVTILDNNYKLKGKLH